MRIPSILAVLLLSGLSLLGQTLGDISGQVADASHSAVPDSTVTLTSASTNAVRQATNFVAETTALGSVFEPNASGARDPVCHGEDREATALRLACGKWRLKRKTLPG